MTTTKVVLLIQYSYKKIICRKIKSGLFDLQLFQKQKLTLKYGILCGANSVPKFPKFPDLKPNRNGWDSFFCFTLGL